MKQDRLPAGYSLLYSEEPSVLLTEKPIYGSLRARLLTIPPRKSVAYFAAGALFSVAVKSQSLERSLEHKEYLPLYVLGPGTSSVLKGRGYRTLARKKWL